MRYIIVGLCALQLTLETTFGQVIGETGRCCYPTGSGNACEINTEAACNALEGNWHEGIESCEGECLTPVGRCCYWDESILKCAVVSQSVCEYVDGQWVGGTTCSQYPCDESGQCCILDGQTASCGIKTAPECTGPGQFWKWNLNCAGPNPCVFGHCCFMEAGSESCDIMPEWACVALQGSWAPGVLDHETIICGAHGACCEEDDPDTCKVKPANECPPIEDGGVWTWGADCQAYNPCAFGHCCYLNEDYEVKCTQTLEAICESLDGYWDEGLTCKEATCNNHADAATLATRNRNATFRPITIAIVKTSTGNGQRTARAACLALCPAPVVMWNQARSSVIF